MSKEWEDDQQPALIDLEQILDCDKVRRHQALDVDELGDILSHHGFETHRAPDGAWKVIVPFPEESDEEETSDVDNVIIEQCVASHHVQDDDDWD